MFINELYKLGKSLPQDDRLTDVRISLVLNLARNGTPLGWLPQTTTVTRIVRKKEVQKEQPGRDYRFPFSVLAKNGGIPDFMSEMSQKVLGIGGDGVPIQDNTEQDPTAQEPEGGKKGKAGITSFQMFWADIRRAFDQIEDAETTDVLGPLLRFYECHLATHQLRQQWLNEVELLRVQNNKLCAVVGDKAMPLGEQRITFAVEGELAFRPDTPLHRYWQQDATRQEDAKNTAFHCTCLISGKPDQPIVKSHMPVFHGVPGTMATGARLYSIDPGTPTYSSYFLEAVENAPISRDVVQNYTRALTMLLEDPRFHRKFGKDVNLMVLSWLRSDLELGAQVTRLLDQPTVDGIRQLLDQFEQGELSGAVDPAFYNLAIITGNAGRVVVRHHVDMGASKLLVNLRQWFDDLDLCPVASEFKSFRSIRMLALATAKEIQRDEEGQVSAQDRYLDPPADVYAALYRAALEGECPQHLLAPAVSRAILAVVKRGHLAVYEMHRFALVRMILNRRSRSMNGNGAPQLTPALDQNNNNPAYLCGRLVSLYSHLQYIAHGRKPNMGVLDRYYRRAATCPRMAIPAMAHLAVAHFAMLGGRGYWLRKRIAEVGAKLVELPGPMNMVGKGFFLIGFYHEEDYLMNNTKREKAANGEAVEGEAASGVVNDEETSEPLQEVVAE